MIVWQHKYDALMKAYEAFRRLAEERAVRIHEQERHIAVLEEALKYATIHKQAPPPEPHKADLPEPIEQHGRGGWRGRAAAASERTKPKPPDSVEAMEQRVVEAGGKKA